MILGTVFEPFPAASPLSVMARGLVEHTLDSTHLNQLFEDHLHFVQNDNTSTAI